MKIPQTLKDFYNDERGVAFEWMLGIITLLVMGLLLAVFIEFVTEYLDPIAQSLGLPASDPTRQMIIRVFKLFPWIITFGVIYWWYNRAQKDSGDVGLRI
jgi:uncharacterized BrkB/YihY/UPF0761 family membrane protein